MGAPAKRPLGWTLPPPRHRLETFSPAVVVASAVMGTAVKLLVGVGLVLLGASTASPPIGHRLLAILRRARPPSPHWVPPSGLNATSAAPVAESPPPLPPPPPPRWGRRFVVAPLGEKRSCGHVAYVLAARGTLLRYATAAAAAATSWATLRAGDALPIALRPRQALSVVASSAVAVYYFHAGAQTFLAAVAPLGEFCGSFRLRVPPAPATVVLVAAAGGGAEVWVDGRPVGAGGWRRVAGGELWWREVALGNGGGGGSHRLQRPNGTFAVLSYGSGRDEEGAGSGAVCECAPLCPPTPRYNPTRLHPPSNCSTSCGETCDCPRDFLLHLNGSHVATTPTRGCHHAGSRYPPGRYFWGDERCTRRCFCPLQEGGEVECREEKCGVGEKCGVEKGVRGCYPTSYGRCRYGRDRRSLTFDGGSFYFGGRCPQELVGTCGARKGSVGFRVVVAAEEEEEEEEERSFVGSVQVEVSGYNVSLSHHFPGRAMVDGLLVNLPHTFHGGKISVARRGWSTFLRTHFRLNVTVTAGSRVVVTVPSTYAGRLCGLCGDFDGDPQNDVPPKGTKEGALCHRPAPRRCSSRAVIARKQRLHGEECGLLVAPKGPFRFCHFRVDPESYFQECVTDYCLFRGHKAVVCQAVTAYAAACQEVGAVLESWRSETFCAPTCPPHAHYELDGTSCPATCHHSENPEECDLPRTEGCFCDEGYVLSGQNCVSPPDCGCHHEGRYYGRGEDFYPNDGCAQRCRCTGSGRVTCQAAPCPPDQECRVENGIRGCHGGHRGRCVLLGDRRLVTFDGLKVTLGGTCRYLLAKALPGDAGEELEVTLENGGGVTATVGGSRVTVRSGRRWSIEVDGESRSLPLSLGDGKTWMTQEGNTVVLQTVQGHRLVYGATAVLLVTVPSTSAGRMCGLCGDFDGNGHNDFTGPDGTRVNGTQELMVAWKVPDEAINCSDTCEKCPGHPPDVTGPYRAANSCGMMVVTPGPFSDCHGEVGPEDFFQHCLQEMGFTGGAVDTLCRSLGAYTTACQEAGAPVKVWRTESFCPLPCGEHSLYALCARSCRGGCARLVHPLPCAQPCFEGCRCSEGFFTDGHRCLLPSTCGCFQDGRYFPVLEEVSVGNCSRRCTCYLHGTLLCEEEGCAPGTGCGVRGGRRGCLPQGGP